MTLNSSTSQKNSRSSKLPMTIARLISSSIKNKKQFKKAHRYKMKSPRPKNKDRRDSSELLNFAEGKLCWIASNAPTQTRNLPETFKTQPLIISLSLRLRSRPSQGCNIKNPFMGISSRIEDPILRSMSDLNCIPRRKCSQVFKLRKSQRN